MKREKKETQAERFKKAARDLGVDDETSAEKFERAFKKIVPPKDSEKSTSRRKA